MKRLQIKYCATEAETNEFLKTLSVDSLEYPRLHAIQYCGKPEGHAHDFETENGTHTEMNISGDVVAIVQYFVDIDDK